MELTEKLGLKKPGLMDNVNISDINDNMDILDEAVGELKEGSTILEDLETKNKTLSGAINELDAEKAGKDELLELAGEGRTTETVKSAYDRANQAFQSASDGKQVVATAITGKGVPTKSSDTFQKMATNIDSIETDKTGDATAIAGDIMKGKTAYAKGNKLIGTLGLTGNALLTHVLAGNTFYNDDLKVKRIGTMPNHGTKNHTLTTQGGQINLAKGYYEDSIIKAQFANLTPSNIKDKVNIGGVVGTLVDMPKTSMELGYTNINLYPSFKAGVNTTEVDVSVPPVQMRKNVLAIVYNRNNLNIYAMSYLLNNEIAFKFHLSHGIPNKLFEITNLKVVGSDVVVTTNAFKDDSAKEYAIRVWVSD